MIKHVSDEEMKLAQLVKDLRMQVAALEVAMMELEDRGWVGLDDTDLASVSGVEVEWARHWEKVLKGKNT